MHKGRTYPFHPQYDRTEGWFFPGYVPWRMVAEVYGTMFPPWNIVPGGYSKVSNVGVPSVSGRTMYYEWTTDLPLYGLRLSLRRTSNKPWRCQWRCVLGNGLITYAVAGRWQAYPQRRVLCVGLPFDENFPPYLPTPGPEIQFYPATYAIGGSPW